jgi:hypothetical protein
VDQSAAELADPITFVVAMDGVLRPAPRRSEHVVCPGGDKVLSAGGISFVRETDRWAVREDDFVCVFCGSDLPRAWKVDPTA